jgi:hypothetical protein
MGLAGWHVAQRKRAVSLRGVVIGVLEELPFVCPLVVAIGSLILIGITLYNDWPQ